MESQSPFKPMEPVTCETPESAFQVGDVVRLRSGGHLMTVLDCGCCGSVQVGYSAGGKIEQEDLPRQALAPIGAEELADIAACERRKHEMPF